MENGSQQTDAKSNPTHNLRYAISDRTSFPGDESDRQSALIAQVRRLASQGVNFVQLREKDLEAGALAALTRELLPVLRSHSPAPKLLINSRADVAVAVGADGVHLTSAPGELTPAQVRQLYAAAGLPEPVVSVSCHTVAQVACARESAASLILFGPVFEKRVAGELVAAGTGLDLLREACQAAAPTPVLALGGITAANSAACVAAGAAGIAAIRLFQEEPSA
jgi:thiamine-phosphate pyrophosphorylase